MSGDTRAQRQRHSQPAELALAPGQGSDRHGAWLRVRAHMDDWWPVWAVLLASRIGVLVVGFLAQYAAAGRGVTPVIPGGFAESGTYIHYADVLANGYTRSNATEFPLLPGLMWLVGSAGIPYPLAALLVVNVCFVVGLIGFALLGQRYVGREAAIAGSMYLALFPTSHFFSIASTESLMLAGLVGAVAFALRGSTGGWLMAAPCAAICALTRPPGVLVGLVLLGITIGQIASGRLRSAPGIAAAVVAGASIPLAVGGFFWYLKGQTGDALAAVHAQAQFGRSMTLDGPIRAVGSAISSVASGSLGEGFELAAALVIAAAIVVFALRAQGERWEVRGWVLFAAASLLMPLATGIVWQMPRFALVILPVFWMLGVLGRRFSWLHAGLMVLLPMALAFRVVFEVVGVSQ